MNKKFKAVISVFLVSIIASACTVFPCAECIIDEMNAKIDSSLLERLNTEEDRIPISIWIKPADISSAETNALEKIGLDKIDSSSINSTAMTEAEKLQKIDAVIIEKRKNVARIYNEYNVNNASLLPDSTTVTSISSYAPVIDAIATKIDIYKISRMAIVDYIYYGEDEDLYSELDISRQVVKANYVQSSTYGGYTGSGIKVGIIEGSDSGLPDNTKVGLPSNRFIVDINCGTYIDDHATSVAMIIAGQGTIGAKGIAPGVSLYCTYGRSLQDSLDWMIENGVHIVNMSAGGEPYNTYTYSARYVDYISFSCNLTFVKSSGNAGIDGITSPGMAYNAITVGNINDKNTISVSDDSLASSSSYFNTKTITSVSKPDICAPGTSIATFDEHAGTGTSFSAPHVTGALALMAQQDSILLYVPGAMKAIIMAGVNKTNHHYIPSQRTVSTSSTNPASSYIQYGAGILDCLNNRNIIESTNYEYGYFLPNNPSSTYQISCTKGQTMRIAIVGMNQKSSPNDTTVIMADFDIEVCRGSEVVAQASTVNNVEIVEFTPTQTGTYTVYVDRIGLMDTSAYYAMAWC